MALANYSDLKKSVITWSHRGDVDLLIDDFILLTESAMFNNSSEPLKVRELESKVSITMSAATEALPAGYQSMRSIKIIDDNGNRELIFKTPQALQQKQGTGKPAYFTVTREIVFDVTPDGAYNLDINYIQKPTGISAANTTNSILTAYPSIYLYGCLAEVFAYTGDNEELQKYKTLFIDAIQGANQTDDDGRYGPSPAARISGPTP